MIFSPAKTRFLWDYNITPGILPNAILQFLDEYDNSTNDENEKKNRERKQTKKHNIGQYIIPTAFCFVIFSLTVWTFSLASVFTYSIYCMRCENI